MSLKPLYPPTLTTAQRDALPLSLRRMDALIRNSTTNQYERWNGTAWEPTALGGASSYTYIAYADDSTGSGYSTDPVGKTFVAFRTSTTPLTPVLGDFAGLWRQFVANTAETVESITAAPIDWSLGLIKDFNLLADVSLSAAQFSNPVEVKAHVIILKNTTGSPRTFTLPSDLAHYAESLAITVANNRRRTLSAVFVDGAYHWAVGAEMKNA